MFWSITEGMLVVAHWFDKWVRAYVEEPDPTGQQNLVRLVDHGGFWTFSNAEMRKIRSDYLTFPFQSIEVSLANIKPKNGKVSFRINFIQKEILFHKVSS